MSKQEQVRRILLATNKIDGVYYRLAKQYGLNENTLAFLYALNDGKKHSQKEISDEWFIPRTTINSIVKRMLSLGYIELDSEGHSKEKNIIITPQGQEYLQSLMTKITVVENKVIDATLENFSPEFIEALEYFSNALEAEFNKTLH